VGDRIMAFNPFKMLKKKEDLVIDLSKTHRETVPEVKTETTNEDNLGFIGSLASASETSTNPTASNIKTNVFDEEKLKRFGRRVDRLLERMELLERKIERIEHRMDIS
jgi:hypothetical protein